MKLPLFSNRNYNTSDTLELILTLLLNSKIISIESVDSFYNKITFLNGSLLYWKCNWPYATFSKGTINIKIDDGEIKYNWNEAMPSRKLIKKLLVKIDNFIANND